MRRQATLNQVQRSATTLNSWDSVLIRCREPNTAIGITWKPREVERGNLEELSGVRKSFVLPRLTVATGCERGRHSRALSRQDAQLAAESGHVAGPALSRPEPAFASPSRFPLRAPSFFRGGAYKPRLPLMLSGTGLDALKIRPRFAMRSACAHYGSHRQRTLELVASGPTSSRSARRNIQTSPC